MSKKISDTKLQAAINWQPFPKQQGIVDSESRFKAICAGRRFGKSALCGYEALKELLLPNKRIWIVAPSYDLTGKIFNNYLVPWFLKVCPSQKANVTLRQPARIRTDWGSFVECKSSDEPKSLLGEELDLLIMDEAARVPKELWLSYLRPTLTSRKGRFVAISTPYGKNWFYDYWMDCKDKGGAFQFSSLDGVSIMEEEWETLRKTTPEHIFKQEYLAQFLEEGTLFRGTREVLDDNCFEDVKANRNYVMGVDLGKYQDFTVLCVLDVYSHKLVHLERFKDIDWPLQKARIVALSKRYNHAKMIIDATGLGDPIASDVMREGVVVDEFKISSQSKKQLVDKLVIWIEQKSIILPAPDLSQEAATLLDELSTFSYEISDFGNVKYAAPQGYHDDCVIALALAVWGLNSPKKESPEKLWTAKPKRRTRYDYV